jgi:PAP2 superfamily
MMSSITETATPGTVRRSVSAFYLCLGLALLWPDSAAADAVTDWNANAGRAALAACIAPGDDPLHESRLYAMMHVAIHDALNAIDRRSRPYAFDGYAAPGTSADAAVAAAARHVLVPVIGQIPFPFPQACRDAGVATVEADYAAALAAIPAGAAKADGIQVGQAAAAAILALRASDGSDTPLLDFAYPQGTGPGEYRFTPGFTFAFAPGWGTVTPFVLNHASPFRANAPYRITSQKYTADFNEVKALGGDDVTTPSARTPEQTQIGLFWIESSPLAWNRLTRSVSASRGLELWENARLFGLLNLSLADGYIASWEAKYHYNFWRPVTAIQTADTDGNPDTVADPTWTPLQLTYPMPDHDSAHSVQGGAAAETLKQFFGTNDIAFDACSLTLPAGERCSDPSPVFRSYTSFSQAANENGVSRILIGIHFRRAVEEGIQHGRQIAKRAANLLLRPVH